MKATIKGLVLEVTTEPNKFKQGEMTRTVMLFQGGKNTIPVKFTGETKKFEECSKSVHKEILMDVEINSWQNGDRSGLSVKCEQ